MPSFLKLLFCTVTVQMSRVHVRLEVGSFYGNIMDMRVKGYFPNDIFLIVTEFTYHEELKSVTARIESHYCYGEI